MKFHIKPQISPPHDHWRGPKSIEFILALIIVVALISSLTSEKLIDLPYYIVPFLILVFIALKVVHIRRQGGTLLEDYTTIGAMVVFSILHISLKGSLNPLLITVFIAILIYATGLMLWVKTKLSSKKITHFLISYVTTLFMVIFLFAGAYLSNSDEFLVNGINNNLSLGEALYFSTVTITTVGYGDITPLSRINRFLAASEAFLGMVINVALLGYVLSSGKVLSEHEHNE
ncbi:MAG: ion channel [Nanoarchaeota archaeon]|mgnify:CR=1 FL=1